MVAAHATKGSRRCRYYVSRSVHEGGSEHAGARTRVPAQALESLAVDRLLGVMRRDVELLRVISWPGASAEAQQLLLSSAKTLLERWDELAPAEQIEFVAATVLAIVVGEDCIVVRLRPSGLRQASLRDEAVATDAKDDDDLHTLRVDAKFERRGLETKLVVSGGAEPIGHARAANALRDALEKALRWNDDLRSGQVASMSAIATREGVTQRYVAHLIKLAFLSPDIMIAIIRGEVPADVSLDRSKKGFPLDWAEQRKALGFPPRPAR